MPQQKSVVMELLERRIRELEKENDDLANENLEMRENFARINALVSDFDVEDSDQDDLSDEEVDEILDEEDFEDDEETDEDSDEEIDEDDE